MKKVLFLSWALLATTVVSATQVLNVEVKNGSRTGHPMWIERNYGPEYIMRADGRLQGGKFEMAPAQYTIHPEPAMDMLTLYSHSGNCQVHLRSDKHGKAMLTLYDLTDKPSRFTAAQAEASFKEHERDAAAAAKPAA